MENKRGCGLGCLAALTAIVGVGVFLVLVVLVFAAGVGVGASRELTAGTEFGVTAPEEERPPQETWIWGRGDADAPKIVRIRLDGVIALDGELGGLFAEPNPHSAANALRRIREATLDPDVRGLYLELDTPGGEVTASDILHFALLRFRDSETNRFVVAHMGSMCCSGGYYVAAAADAIIAHPTTVTGSIGVILSAFNAAELAQKIGVRSVAIATGANKNLLDPLEPVNEEHVEIFRKVLASDYERFITLVAAGRDLPVEDVRKIADGRILSAAEARELKLIDAIGYREDAEEILEQLADAKDGVRVVRYDEELSWRRILSSLSMSAGRGGLAAAVRGAVEGRAAPRLEFRVK